MTLAEINALRAERTELLDLLGDIQHALARLDEHRPAPPLIWEAQAHITLGNALRFRAEHDLLAPANSKLRTQNAKLK